MTAAIKLSDANLGKLPAGVQRPTYDRTRLTPGIVHIGLGNFHRGHQAWYLHRLMQQGDALDWAIIGAGVMPLDEPQRQKLAAQDYLTTLIELDPNGSSVEVVGSMIDYVPIAQGNGPLIERMADPTTRIVAMTVTEGGYFLDPSTKLFDAEHADIQHDVAHPDRPRTAFGAIVAALARRRVCGDGPMTLQSCDNLQGNGNILRQTVVSLSRLTDPDLAEWIDNTCSFPNSMVDCIVPATGPKELSLVRDCGIDDAVPVTHENYRQWVIEDDFCAGRPPWERVGATLTNSVHDYEAMKIRILNGGHQIVANAGEILSIETISGSMQHPLIRVVFNKIATREIVPHVLPVPGMSPTAYVDLVERRFSNPLIVDTTRRVAFDGSSRHTGFILPVIQDALAADAPIDGLALAEALWARMCEGTREDGTKIASNDPIWEQLTQTARAAKADPLAWLDQRTLYGDLADNPRFAQAFGHWLALLWSAGTESALTSYANVEAKTGFYAT